MPVQYIKRCEGRDICKLVLITLTYNNYKLHVTLYTIQTESNHYYIPTGIELLDSKKS